MGKGTLRGPKGRVRGRGCKPFVPEWLRLPASDAQLGRPMLDGRLNVVPVHSEVYPGVWHGHADAHVEAYYLHVDRRVDVNGTMVLVQERIGRWPGYPDAHVTAYRRHLNKVAAEPAGATRGPVKAGKVHVPGLLDGVYVDAAFYEKRAGLGFAVVQDGHATLYAMKWDFTQQVPGRQYHKPSSGQAERAAIEVALATWPDMKVYCDCSGEVSAATKRYGEGRVLLVNRRYNTLAHNAARRAHHGSTLYPCPPLPKKEPEGKD